MNKIVSLLAITAFCTITTVMNGALPPGKQWRDEAKEAWRVGRIKGGLDTDTIKIIQEYLVPRIVPVTITNVEPSLTQFGIDVADERTGNKLNYYRLYLNTPLVINQLPGKFFEGAKRGESPEQYLLRHAIETRKLFQQTVNLPLRPLLITIENPDYNEIYGQIRLDPSDLIKIKQIGFAGELVHFDYTDGTTKSEKYELI